MPRKLIDITDQRFGRLIATERVGKANNGNMIWRCKCDCGNERLVPAGNLRSGAIVSCGCLTVEKRMERLAREEKKNIRAKEMTTT